MEIQSPPEKKFKSVRRDYSADVGMSRLREFSPFGWDPKLSRTGNCRLVLESEVYTQATPETVGKQQKRSIACTVITCSSGVSKICKGLAKRLGNEHTYPKRKWKIKSKIVRDKLELFSLPLRRPSNDV